MSDVLTIKNSSTLFSVIFFPSIKMMQSLLVQRHVSCRLQNVINNRLNSEINYLHVWFLDAPYFFGLNITFSLHNFNTAMNKKSKINRTKYDLLPQNGSAFVSTERSGIRHFFKRQNQLRRCFYLLWKKFLLEFFKSFKIQSTIGLI